MKRIHLLMVGGFLGAGKTTLLWEAARQLTERRLRVGLVTNDQAPDLVDTAWLGQRGVAVREVAGSCFCCNYPALVAATENLRQAAEADVLLAEPVGSCTDLSATLMQPLKNQFAAELALSPLSVVADPLRLRELLSGNSTLHPDAAYILRKQLEEADVILLNKTDLLEPQARRELADDLRNSLPGTEIREISARTGTGVAEWLDDMLAREDGGTRLAQVDYDRYANGEAVLGWLNASVLLRSADPDWTAYAQSLLQGLRDELAKADAAIGHVKLLVSAGEEFCVANLTQAEGPVEVRGQAGTAPEASLTLNARAQIAPAELEALVRETLARCSGTAVVWTVANLRCFRPGRPNPTHRYDHIV